MCGYYGVKSKSPNLTFSKHTNHLLSDSPHSVQTWCDCTIYETARNPGDLSLSRLPAEAEQKSGDNEKSCSFRTQTSFHGVIVAHWRWPQKGKRPAIPEICLWVCECWGPCSWAKEAEPSTPSPWCWGDKRHRTHLPLILLEWGPVLSHIAPISLPADLTCSISNIGLNLQTCYMCCSLRSLSTCWSLSDWQSTSASSANCGDDKPAVRVMSLCPSGSVCARRCVYLSIRTGVGASSVSFHNSSSPVSQFCASATESTAK